MLLLQKLKSMEHSFRTSQTFKRLCSVGMLVAAISNTNQRPSWVSSFLIISPVRSELTYAPSGRQTCSISNRTV